MERVTSKDVDQAFRVFATAYEHTHGVPDGHTLELERYAPGDGVTRYRVALREIVGGAIHTPFGSSFWLGAREAERALKFGADVLWASTYQHNAVKPTSPLYNVIALNT